MIDVSKIEYKEWKDYIERRHNAGVDWSYIRYMATKPSDSNQRHLLEQIDDKTFDGWAELGIDEWFELFDVVKTQIEDFEATGMADWSGVSAGRQRKLDMSAVYDDPNSCWNRYKYKLLNVTKFSDNTVKSLQAGCEWIVRNLRPDTDESVKGLVVGNVQSGKTANMAGVIAMAADLGYNFFIVLSGMITNLREQTAKRLYADLAMLDNVADPKLKMAWRVLENPNPKSPVSDRLSSLVLTPTIDGETNPHRYLTVCLKNKKRLRDLLGWLQMQDSLEKTGQLKVLIIDDECDQAGVNTADVAVGEQTRIFQLIKGLCDHARPAPRDEVKPGNRYKCANYIAYSATPYANILNDGNEQTSLFPRDFICTLPMSPSYWGPNRFFGTYEESRAKDPFSSFPLVNEITRDDLQAVRAIHNQGSVRVPGSLAEAVNWFVCAGAVRRLAGSKKPVSMLVHTSNKIHDHSSVAVSIEKYLENLLESVALHGEAALGSVRKTYEDQCNALSAADIQDLFPDYETKAGSEIKDLPVFADISHLVLGILRERIARIRLSDDDTGHSFEFEKGIHLCVDNSAGNSAQMGAPGEEFTIRIKYPENGQDVSVAPLFLVVGGNTLSRGLTLEGLVSSYFVRTVRQSDSLMQMGRWFGYRFDYELLPRVWMSKETLAKFCLLNEVDLDLRRSLREAMDAGLPPDQMIPCIRDTSTVISSFTLTSPRKMQMAEISEADYGGRQQVAVTYDKDETILASNERAVKEFLSGIEMFVPAGPYAPANWCSYGINWNVVKSFLSSYRFSNEGRDFRRMDLFFDYVERDLAGRDWTIVVSGTIPNDPQRTFAFGNGYSVGKVGRKVNKQGDGYFAFKHVTAPVDFVCDIEHELDCQPGTEKYVSGTTKASIGYYRSHATKRGKDRTPLLIINCIDATYLNEKHQLGLSRDIFGIAFYLPRAQAGAIGSYTKLRVSNLVPSDNDESEV